MDDGVRTAPGPEQPQQPPQYPCYLRRKSSGSRSHGRSHNRREPKPIRRLLRKSGKATVCRRRIPQRRFRYLLDLANTLIDARWRWTAATLAALFIATWLVFAVVWMLIASSNGDLEVAEEEAGEDGAASTKTPCLEGVRGFAGYFLFSVETQTTIGYGARTVTENCPEAVMVMAVQVVFGTGLCGALVSIVYAKMISPGRFRPRSCFSKSAVICQRDGVLCLIFRVRDEHRRYHLSPAISAYLVLNRTAGPSLRRIPLDPPGPLIWPVEAVHRITPASPFWDLSARDLILKRFELIVTIEGSSEATSQASKAGSSYMSTEIRWGSRFRPCIETDANGRYVVVRKRFNETEEVLTPLCSAKRLQEVLSETRSSADSSSVYLPRNVFTPTLSRTVWEEEEGDEGEDSSSGIGSMRTSLFSPASTRSGGSGAADLLSPVSTRSNVTVTVADVHRMDEGPEDAGEEMGGPELPREERENDIYTVHEETGYSEDEDRFVYMEEKDESTSDTCDEDERERAESPYARRRPFSVEIRRNRVSRQESIRSNRSSGSSLLASLQSYTNIFTRQNARNVIETDF